MTNELIKLDLKNDFTKIVKKVQKVEDDFLQPFNLTHFHSHYLLDLYLSGGATMQGMSARLGCDKANTTRVVKDLMSKDLVEKSGGIRKFVLKLTEKGNQIAIKIKNKVENFLQHVFADFSNEEKAMFAHLFNKVVAGVSSAAEEG